MNVTRAAPFDNAFRKIAENTPYECRNWDLRMYTQNLWIEETGSLLIKKGRWRQNSRIQKFNRFVLSITAEDLANRDFDQLFFLVRVIDSIANRVLQLPRAGRMHSETMTAQKKWRQILLEFLRDLPEDQRPSVQSLEAMQKLLPLLLSDSNRYAAMPSKDAYLISQLAALPQIEQIEYTEMHVLPDREEMIFYFNLHQLVSGQELKKRVCLQIQDRWLLSEPEKEDIAETIPVAHLIPFVLTHIQDPFSQQLIPALVKRADHKDWENILTDFSPKFPLQNFQAWDLLRRLFPGQKPAGSLSLAEALFQRLDPAFLAKTEEDPHWKILGRLFSAPGVRWKPGNHSQRGNVLAPELFSDLFFSLLYDDAERKGMLSIDFKELPRATFDLVQSLRLENPEIRLFNLRSIPLSGEIELEVHRFKFPIKKWMIEKTNFHMGGQFIQVNQNFTSLIDAALKKLIPLDMSKQVAKEFKQGVFREFLYFLRDDDPIRWSLDQKPDCLPLYLCTLHLVASWMNEASLIRWVETFREDVNSLIPKIMQMHGLSQRCKTNIGAIKELHQVILSLNEIVASINRHFDHAFFFRKEDAIEVIEYLEEHIAAFASQASKQQYREDLQTFRQEAKKLQDKKGSFLLMDPLIGDPEDDEKTFLTVLFTNYLKIMNSFSENLKLIIRSSYEDSDLERSSSDIFETFRRLMPELYDSLMQDLKKSKRTPSLRDYTFKAQ